MSKIHMLDEERTAYVKRFHFPDTYKARREALCGALEPSGPPSARHFFAHPDECEDVTCQECVELLLLDPWAGRIVSGG